MPAGLHCLLQAARIHAGQRVAQFQDDVLTADSAVVFTGVEVQQAEEVTLDMMKNLHLVNFRNASVGSSIQV